MTAAVLVCGAMFDGAVRDGEIVEIGRSVSRPDGAETIELTDRTVIPGFGDTHVHVTMNAATLPRQTLDSSALLGVFRPGACADIVATRGNPLEDLAVTAAVDFVIWAGTVHRRPGETGSP